VSEPRAFFARLAHDLAAAHGAALVAVGDRLGLYRALAEAPATPAELARRTSTNERYVLEWLRHQEASGYVERRGEAYALSETQRQAFAEEGGPAFAVPAFQLATGLAGMVDAAVEAFRTGAGIDPGRYASDAREAIARGSASLAETRLRGWLPADVAARLADGGSGVDLGCGQGGIVRVLATAFPRARCLGLDVDERALDEARRASAALGDRVRFECSSSEALAGAWDLVTCIDALHDLPDPLAALRLIRAALGPEGCALVVEPCASGRPEAFVRILSAISTLYCVPVGRAGGGEGRGALADEGDLVRLLGTAGFARVRVVERLPLHVVVEARP
jgi:2-polyprenyl-3-methyl-5-hydroxy-6-metoxy-1,4-benzoquinol methylase